MADNFIPGLQQAKNCRIKRLRELPIPGQTLVRVGDSVSPETIVAKAELPGDVQILRVSELLGVEPSDLIAGIKVRVGTLVKKNDLLCEHKGLFGLFKSRFLSPSDGLVDFISETSGHLGLRSSSQLLEVNAYCGGKVSAVQEGSSVEIETSATLIQGIFGVGGERFGKIHLLDISPDEPLRLQHLPSTVSGAILVGGTIPDHEVLKVLTEAGAAGLVVGGIDDIALKKFLGFDIGLAITGNEDISYSLMVTEGFGKLSMSERVRSLLAPHQSALACMNGSTQIRAGAIRPEIIIPTPDNNDAVESSNTQGLSIGAKVRLIRVPYFGELGEVVDLPAKPEKLEAGTMARVLKVRLLNGSVISVPRANAEILF